MLQYRNLWHPAHFDTLTPSGTYVLVPVDTPSVHMKQFAHVSSRRSVSKEPTIGLLIDATNWPGSKSTLANSPFPMLSPFSLAQTEDLAGRNGADELAHPSSASSASSATFSTCLMGMLDVYVEGQIVVRRGDTKLCLVTSWVAEPHRVEIYH